MIVIPAADVRGGRCVRLLRGDFTHETVYAEEPSQVVLEFVRQGAERVHIVDLDAARGVPDVLSRDAARAAVVALRETDATAEFGGGVRSPEAARAWLELGADLVVLGSLAVRRPEVAAEICRAHPGRVLLGLDVRDGVAQAQGWTEAAGDALAHLRRWSDWEAAGVVLTNIARDGALTGPDLEGLEACIAAYSRPVIASGGVASLEDLIALADIGAAGAIVGRALYEGRIDLSAALRLFPARPQAQRHG
ncbi:MAG TPA: 1-(5-phosphoribosyl)-5-[(5-phosphoribosylamino)methylideneamino] imidazole-4-carboxamide isomerase [Candidatus Dormibacteraeota bacterium]|nr:1-(5-phosphoribosyl)-5-[(5-phosphoribosylamino)methylideneamino] imidazole-4-carboxamide isomerase [Candidatus Dormibacteraeota bacterium]